MKAIFAIVSVMACLAPVVSRGAAISPVSGSFKSSSSRSVTASTNRSFNLSSTGVFSGSGNSSFDESVTRSFTASGTGLTNTSGNSSTGTPLLAAANGGLASGWNGQVSTNALGQASPFVPAFVDGGGDSLGGPPETPASAEMRGQAQIISAAGNYNLATAVAADRLADAESKSLRNQTDWVRTYYATREAGRLGRDKERAPHATFEELASRAHAAAPRALTTNQIDPVSGELHWPGYLQDARFAPQRAAIEECAINWVRYGELTYSDRAKVRENITIMFDDLRSQVADIPPHEYVACRSFLDSLLYATTQTLL